MGGAMSTETSLKAMISELTEQIQYLRGAITNLNDQIGYLTMPTVKIIEAYSLSKKNYDKINELIKEHNELVKKARVEIVNEKTWASKEIAKMIDKYNDMHDKVALALEKSTETINNMNTELEKIRKYHKDKIDDIIKQYKDKLEKIAKYFEEKVKGGKQ